MKRLVIATVVVLSAAICFSDSANAQQPGWAGFQPFGFYQPYGARIGSTLGTPPYFATNPPVYYGARYARPYGMSPFASPPVLSAPAGYQGRLRSTFQQTPLSAPVILPNPHVSKSKTIRRAVAKKGDVQLNPFVLSDNKLAQN
ncbi:MAG: hypothetical protein HKN47_15435 [Pirellulaceae bacterium]|nr:hypothetical protein [Pirellulaceae bacterium]